MYVHTVQYLYCNFIRERKKKEVTLLRTGRLMNRNILRAVAIKLDRLFAKLSMYLCTHTVEHVCMYVCMYRRTPVGGGGFTNMAEPFSRVSTRDQLMSILTQPLHQEFK